MMLAPRNTSGSFFLSRIGRQVRLALGLTVLAVPLSGCGTGGRGRFSELVKPRAPRERASTARSRPTTASMTQAICAAWPDAKILALTMHSEALYLVPFLEAGGLGYVQKSVADHEVLQAIQRLHQGETYIHDQGIAALVRQQQGQPHARQRPARPPLGQERLPGSLRRVVLARAKPEPPL